MRPTQRREFTPTWLNAVAVLGGGRPVELGAGFAAAYVGLAAPLTPAVVAAVSPRAEVWAWDPSPDRVASLSAVRDRAEIRNLTVHDRPRRPDQLGAAPCDVAVVDASSGAVGDHFLDRLVPLVAHSLRPGGLVAVAYPTVVGSSETAPLAHLLRAMVWRDPRTPTAALRDALARVDELRSRGAGYLVNRPAVAGWLDHLRTCPETEAWDDHLAFEPGAASHAEVAAAMSSIGCTFVGAAGLDDRFGDGSTTQPDPSLSPVLRETFRDLTVRPRRRVDVFRLGAEVPDRAEHRRMLGAMELTAVLAAPDGGSMADALPLDPDDRQRLAEGSVRTSDLRLPGGSQRGGVLAELFASGKAHPVVSGELDLDAVAAAARLNAVVGRPPVPSADRILAVPRIGGALPAVPRLGRDERAYLGLT